MIKLYLLEEQSEYGSRYLETRGTIKSFTSYKSAQKYINRYKLEGFKPVEYVAAKKACSKSGNLINNDLLREYLINLLSDNSTRIDGDVAFDTEVNIIRFRPLGSPDNSQVGDCTEIIECFMRIEKDV